MIEDMSLCPLCGTWAVGHFPKRGGQAVGFVWRMDLASFVCHRCDFLLGPDNVRLQAMQLCKDPVRVTGEYMRTWEGGRYA